VTREDAEQAYHDLTVWVNWKMICMGLDYQEPSKWYHDIYVYEELSGDCICPMGQKAVSPAEQLKLWTLKYQEFRSLGNQELNGFLIDRINEIRRGDV